MNRIYLLFIAFIAVHISAFGKDYSYIIVARNDTDSVYCAKHFRLYGFEKRPYHSSENHLWVR